MDASTVGDVTWRKYVESITDDGPTAIAARIGVTAPSVSRWWGPTSRPRPEQAASFARAYNRPVLEAFIAAGFLTAEEAGEKPSAPPSLTSLDDDELLAEVRRRMQEGRNEGQLPEAEKSRDGGVVIDMPIAARTTPGRTASKNRPHIHDHIGEESQDDADSRRGSDNIDPSDTDA